MADLKRMRMRVELDDGRTLIAAVDHRDLVRWDITHQRKGWPAQENAKFLFQGFLAWSALARDGELKNDDTGQTMTVEKFLDAAINLEDLGEEDIPPGPTAAGTTSSASSPSPPASPHPSGGTDPQRT